MLKASDTNLLFGDIAKPFCLPRKHLGLATSQIPAMQAQAHAAMNRWSPSVYLPEASRALVLESTTPGLSVSEELSSRGFQLQPSVLAPSTRDGSLTRLSSPRSNHLYVTTTLTWRPLPEQEDSWSRGTLPSTQLSIIRNHTAGHKLKKLLPSSAYLRHVNQLRLWQPP